MRFAVIHFPGSTGERDAADALLDCLGQEVRLVWHLETSLGETDAVILPGGFGFGDALRCGAIASHSPVMTAVRKFAEAGGLVLGIGNGFQILCEAGLLPGGLTRNSSLQFRSEYVFVHTATRRSAFTRAVPGGRVLRLPIAHGHGCFVAPPDTLAAIRAKDQVLWEYTSAAGHPSTDANPNGSMHHIAGICSPRRNVAGLMPHPERACDPEVGGTDGRLIFDGMLAYLRDHVAATASRP